MASTNFLRSSPLTKSAVLGLVIFVSIGAAGLLLKRRSIDAYKSSLERLKQKEFSPARLAVLSRQALRYDACRTDDMRRPKPCRKPRSDKRLSPSPSIACDLPPPHHSITSSARGSSEGGDGEASAVGLFDRQIAWLCSIYKDCRTSKSLAEVDAHTRSGPRLRQDRDIRSRGAGASA